MAAKQPRPDRRAMTRAGEANVERILDAALTVFARYGMRGARVEEVAAAAGMSKTNLLYYFKSKDALYTAVLARTLEMWVQPLIALDPEAEPRDALATYIAAKLDYSRAHPEASRLFAMEIMQGAPHLAPMLSGALKSIVDDKRATIAIWIERGKLRPIAAPHLIFAIWAATQHYADFAVQISAVLGRSLDDPAFFEEARREITSLVLDGALAKESA